MSTSGVSETRADADPTETNGTAEADALAVERQVWSQWQAALVAAGFGPMPVADWDGDN